MNVTYVLFLRRDVRSVDMSARKFQRKLHLNCRIFKSQSTTGSDFIFAIMQERRIRTELRCNLIVIWLKYQTASSTYSRSFYLTGDRIGRIDRIDRIANDYLFLCRFIRIYLQLVTLGWIVRCY